MTQCVKITFTDWLFEIKNRGLSLNFKRTFITLFFEKVYVSCLTGSDPFQMKKKLLASRFEWDPILRLCNGR